MDVGPLEPLRTAEKRLMRSDAWLFSLGPMTQFRTQVTMCLLGCVKGKLTPRQRIEGLGEIEARGQNMVANSSDATRKEHEN